jgi:hypothetical protein
MYGQSGQAGNLACNCFPRFPVLQGEMDRPCRARPADPAPGRGGPERRRRPRPDGTGEPRSVLGPCRTGTPGARAVASGHQGKTRIPGRWLPSSSSRHEASGQIRLWSRRSEGRVSPPAAASPPALGHEAVVTEAGLTLWLSWSRRRHVDASSFLPAVPPACHKQRSPAVSSGQSRSFREGRHGGVSAPDLRCWSRPKLHGMQGVKHVGPGSTFWSLATRPGRCRGSDPEGRRRRLHRLVGHS